MQHISTAAVGSGIPQMKCVLAGGASPYPEPDPYPNRYLTLALTLITDPNPNPTRCVLAGGARIDDYLSARTLAAKVPP